MMHIRCLIVSLSLLLYASTVAANTSHLASPLNDLRLTGEAELRILFLSIYQSRLYTVNGSFESIDAPLALEIEYLKNVTAEKLVSSTRDEWVHQGIYDLDTESAEAWLVQLQALWPDIKSRDVLLMRFNQDGSSEFFFNGKSLGVIQDDRFGPRFLAIWLAPETRFPATRQQLIGNSSPTTTDQ